MTAALHAEWTKLRTVPGPAWLLLGLAVATVVLGAVAASALDCTATLCLGDPVKSALTGVQLGQALAAVLGVLVIGDEFGTGMIRTTALAMPRRGRMLAAKAIVLTAPTLLAAAVAVTASVIAGHYLLAGRHVPADPGDPAAQGGLASSGGALASPGGALVARRIDLLAPATLRAATGTALYLTLIALLALGIAAAVRDTAAAIGITLGLLYLFPLLTAVIGNPAWHRHLQQIGPSIAGLSIQTTVGTKSLPIGPWHGIGVLALWSIAALALGYTLIRLRDV